MARRFTDFLCVTWRLCAFAVMNCGSYVYVRVGSGGVTPAGSPYSCALSAIATIT
jgi:hypothetical protein